jgi:hypothetical protein
MDHYKFRVRQDTKNCIVVFGRVYVPMFHEPPPDGYAVSNDDFEIVSQV